MTDRVLLPTESQICAWIERVFAEGVRRPGYPADRWCETWVQEQFRAFGLERVRAEPVTVQSWQPREASLGVTTEAGEAIEIPCFQLPYSATPVDLDAALVSPDHADPATVAGAIVLRDVPLMRVPYAWYQNIATYSYDPDRSFDGASHTLPFARELMDVMARSIEAGAAGFIGVLKDYPGDSYQYFVPYDAKPRPIPGVWIRGSDGERLRALTRGPARARLRLEAASETITSYNIVAELPGRDEETIVIGSHHDGPWSSAVEDASGIALVLAQAAYWSKLPAAARPHRLIFLLNAGHMAGGAGQAAFVRENRAQLERCVLAVHLEHVASEMTEDGGALHPSGRPEARWWFTSRINRLEASLREAIEAEGLGRSLILRPDTFGEKPTTDGADFYPAGVPIVQHLAAPFYLFDAMDTLDKIHRPSLLPITRAAIRIVESTAGVSAAEMRADLVKTG